MTRFIVFAVAGWMIVPASAAERTPSQTINTYVFCEGSRVGGSYPPYMKDTCSAAAKEFTALPNSPEKTAATKRVSPQVKP